MSVHQVSKAHSSLEQQAKSVACCLRELLASAQFNKVGEYGRNITSTSDITAGKEKLEQKVINFDKLNEAGLQDGRWDVVYITLGTTRKIAGSDAAFEKIDRDYVINAAKAAKVPDLNQRVVYLSSSSANHTSSFLYPRSKGGTENGLAKLGYSDIIIFHPGFLAGAQRKDRPAENGYITGVLSHVSDSVEIQIPTLAKAIYRAGILGSGALPANAEASTETKDGTGFIVIPNSGAIALGSAKEV